MTLCGWQDVKIQLLIYLPFDSHSEVTLCGWHDVKITYPLSI